MITGAATGIGRATAELFARNGARVVLFGLGGATLDEAATATGGAAVHGDVTHLGDIAAALSSCGGALDIVVNAAGLIAAFNSSPEGVSYAASKAGVVSYTRSLAYAHGGDGIRANAVAPGWVHTPMSEYEMQLAAAKNGTTPEIEFAGVKARIALRRIAQPSEIASCCLFLASDDASFVTGAVLVADGGGRAPTQNRAV